MDNTVTTVNKTLLLFLESCLESKLQNVSPQKER